MTSYQPPFTITPAIINLVADISENLGRLKKYTLTAQDRQVAK